MSFIDSNEVDSVVRSRMSDGESTTLKPEEDEEPPEVILEEDDEVSLADLYMPPNEAGSAASVQVDLDWMEICKENRLCMKGLKYYAFPDGYELVLSVVGSRVTDCPAGHVAIYAHTLDIGLYFPLDPFIV